MGETLPTQGSLGVAASVNVGFQGPTLHEARHRLWFRGAVRWTPKFGQVAKRESRSKNRTETRSRT